MVKKIFIYCFLLSMYLTELVYAQGCDVLRVSGGQEWKPFAYINPETQEPEGIGYDFAKLIGKQLDLQVKIDVTLPWKRVQLYCETGEIDLIASLYWTKERSMRFQYTNPYYEDEVRIFVVKGKEFAFEKYEDLIGRIGAMPYGGSWGEEFDSFAKKNKLKLEGVATIEQRAAKILSGRNDYFIQGYYLGMTYLEQAGLQGRIVALPKPINTNDVYFAVSPMTPCLDLVTKINAIIDKSKKDGTLQAIIDRHKN